MTKIQNTLLISVLTLLVFYAIGWWVSIHKQHIVSVAPISACGFTVLSPHANTEISLPVTVTGTVERPETGCTWTMFEGQAGSAQLYSYMNDAWQAVGDAVPTPVAEWMATSTTFATTIGSHDTNVNIPNGTKMKIVFTEENPSGNRVSDTLTFPFTIKNQ